MGDDGKMEDDVAGTLIISPEGAGIGIGTGVGLSCC